MGSRRRGYVLLGGGLVALGLLLLAGAAAGTFRFMSPNALFVAASLLMVIGLVLQDVVADAMSTEVVARVDADGRPRAKEDIERDLGMVQVLGRLALSLGASHRGARRLAGVGAALFDRVPDRAGDPPDLDQRRDAGAARDTGARAIDWKVLGGGLVFGAFVVAMGLGDFPLGQEIVFLVSMTS